SSIVGMVIYESVLSMAPSPSSAPFPILSVVAECSQLQVIGVAARWVVAFVAHKQAKTNRTVGEVIGDSVGEMLVDALHVRQPIAVAVSLLLPLPALTNDRKMI